MEFGKTAPTRAWGYVRVSTQKQAEEGVSLAAQEDFVRDYAKLRRLNLLGIFRDEGISGRKMDNRPGFQQLMDTIQRNDVVIAWCLSRISRSTRDALHIAEVLREKGAHMACVKEQIDTSTAMGQFFFTVTAALSQLETDQIKERTIAGMDKLRRQGRAVGAPPYGYMKKSPEQGSGLIQNPAEQAVIRLMLQKRHEYKNPKETNPHKLRYKSYHVIAKELNDEGYQAQNAQKWYATSVSNIIHRYTRENYTIPTRGRDNPIQSNYDDDLTPDKIQEKQDDESEEQSLSDNENNKNNEQIELALSDNELHIDKVDNYDNHEKLEENILDNKFKSNKEKNMSDDELLY